MQPNILHFNSLSSNGITLNGITLNGITLNGITLNGITLNGITLNGISVNGITLNGITLNGITLNGINLNGITLHDVVLSGFPLNEIALSQVKLNGAHLDSAQAANMQIALYYLTACALEPGQCITVYDLDGNQLTYCGVHGLDPDWNTGLPDLSLSESVGTCVIEEARADGHDVVYEPVQLAAFKSVLSYLVECALPEGESVTIIDEQGQQVAYHGALGLAPEWATGPLSQQGERLVSACLAARGNALHQPVQISLRGAGLTATAVERDLYSTHEGAFWANLFAPQPYINACLADGGGISGRLCAQTGLCGFNIVGRCKDVCTTQDSVDGVYSGCAGETAVINTFLSLGKQIAFGSNHSCLLEPDGSIWCWGKNTSGELGLGYTSSNEQEPRPVLLAERVVEVTNGAAHTCARRSDGTLWCWGNNDHGQLGNDQPHGSSQPVQVASMKSDVASLGVGKYHSCGHKTDGSLWCWGNNDHGQLGDGTTLTRSQPTRVQALGMQVANISTGTNAQSTCAVTNEGDLYCWGRNNHGQVGNGAKADQHTPVPIATDRENHPFNNVVDVCGGETHTCARRVDGDVWCWGQDRFHQLGNGEPAQSMQRPVQVQLPVPAAARGLTCGRQHTCVIGVDRSVWCWGNNQDGQLGNGTYAPSAVPVQTVGLPVAIARITAAENHTCAIAKTNEVWCWGRDAQNIFYPRQRSNVPLQVLD